MASLSNSGQFWNVPVTVEVFNGEYDEEERDDDYIITVRYPGQPSRSFVGIESSVTWELERDHVTLLVMDKVEHCLRLKTPIITTL